MIGRSPPRLDGPEKVTGRALYTADLLGRFPGALCIKIVRCPYAHARIKSVAVDRAQRMPGVAAVITGHEPGMDWSLFPPHARLAVTEAVWAGQAVAMVAAEGEDTALRAAAAVVVEYEPLPHVLTWKEAIVDEPVSIVDPGQRQRQRDPRCRFVSPNIAGEYHLRTGDTAAMERADIVVEDEFWCGKKSHAQLERPMAIAEYQAGGMLTIHSNGCGVHRAIKQTLCNLFSLPRSRVRAVQPYTGGNFGNRNIPYVEVLCALVALKTGRTAYLQYSREEMFLASPSNVACFSHLRMGADKSGTLLAMQCTLLEEIGASVGNTAYTGRLFSSNLCSLYQIPHVCLDGYSILTNTVPGGPYRGPGTSEAVFGLEVLMDRLAAKIGLSPLAIRQRNLLQQGDKNSYGETVTSIGLNACLKTVAEAVSLEQPSTGPDGPWLRGKGIACAAKQSSLLGRSEAEVLYHEDGFVELRASCDKHGMGADTALAQIVAQELQLPLSRISVKLGDTDMTPFDHYSASCRSIYNTGNAVKYACRDVINKLCEAAARQVGVHRDMVRIEGHNALITGSHIDRVPIAGLFPAQSPQVQENWGLHAGSPVRGVGVFCPAPGVAFDEDGRTPRMWNWFQYSATGVEVAVNSKTGQIQVLQVANAADTGNPLHPKMVEGQLEGAAHMAIGFSLAEEHLYDSHGRIANANLADYRIPTVLDMPTTDCVHRFICPDPLPDGPYGAKGMAEAATGALAAAVANAVCQATGIRIHHYPMTAEVVLAAMKAGRKQHESRR